MPAPTFNDASWDASWLSLYGWIYPSQWAKSDTELKNAITTTYKLAREEVNKLGPQIGEMERLLEDWQEMLDDFARTIQYWEADYVLEQLTYIYQEAKQQVESDRQLVAAKKKPAKIEETPSTPPVAMKLKKAKKKKKSGGGATDMSDEAFASAMMGYSKATAKTPPSKVRPVSRPYVPPTPEQIWTSRQRKMATECDNGIKFGTHAVNQDSVLRHLALGPGDGDFWQYRATSENSHVRILKSATKQFWTKGLSHDEERRKGRFMVYCRIGSSNEFVYVSGQHHPEEHNG